MAEETISDRSSSWPRCTWLESDVTSIQPRTFGQLPSLVFHIDVTLDACTMHSWTSKIRHFADSITSLAPGDTVSISNCNLESKQPEGLTRSNWWWAPWHVVYTQTIPDHHHLHVILLDASELCPTHLGVHGIALEGILEATRCCPLTGESERWKDERHFFGMLLGEKRRSRESQLSLSHQMN